MISVLLALSSLSFASEGEQLEVWSEVGVKADLPKDLELSLTEELRATTREGVFADEVLTDVGLGWKGWKDLGVILGYRYIFKDVGAEDAKRNQRVQLDLIYKVKLKPVRLDARLRYQQRPPWMDEDPKQAVRLKLGIRPRTDWKVMPFGTVEAVNRLSDSGLHKINSIAGVRIKQKHWGAKLYYRMEQPVSDPTDPRNHIIAVSFSGSIDLD